jgi:hypothetical protein
MALSKVKVEEKVKDGTYQLVTEEKKKSAVWEVFRFIVDENQERLHEFVACSKCFKVYICNHSTGTSNLLKHVCEKAETRPTRYLSSFF